MKITPMSFKWLPTPSGIFGIVCFVVLAICKGPKILSSGDSYTHIKVGQWLLENDWFYANEIFSQTVTETFWRNHSWLAEIIMAWLHEQGGLAAVGLLFVLIASLCFTFLYLLTENRVNHPLKNLALVTPVFLLALPDLHASPLLFSWFFTSLTLLVLYRYDRWRPILPIIMVCWVNLDAGFYIGLMLQGISWLGAIFENRDLGWRHAVLKEKQALVIFVLSMLACGVTPTGYQLLYLMFEATPEIVSKFMPGWQSPDLQKLWTLRYYLVALVLALFLQKRRLSWTHFLLIGLFLDIALTHQKNVSLAVMCLLPVWSELITGSNFCLKLDNSDKTENFYQNLSMRSGPIIISFLGIILITASIATDVFNQPPLNTLFTFSNRCPQNTFEYLNRQHPEGNVFNYYPWGSCLSYAKDGNIPAFIDEFPGKYDWDVMEDYLKITQVEPEADDLIDKHGIDWVIFPEDARLVTYLRKTGQWEEVYRDNQASILTRNGY